MKFLTYIVDEKQVKIKDAITTISSLNASQKLVASAMPKLVKLILTVPAGLQLSVGHRTMNDRNKCLTDLKLFQSDIVSERKIKT